MTRDDTAYRQLATAAYVAETEGLIGYENVLRRIQDEDLLGRDCTRAERNTLRAWFGLGREVSETEQCA